jgi:non-canonical poly(A) RNA polymerase PAPD5/7
MLFSTSDIDLVIVSPSISREKNAQKRILFQISGLLKSARLGTDIVVIGKARVPIVKFVTVQGGFKVDISLNMMNGIHVGKRVTQLFKEVGEEPARSLIMVTKAFLSQRNMNEVYSGGLGSYSIICLVVSFLQVRDRGNQCVRRVRSF